MVDDPNRPGVHGHSSVSDSDRPAKSSILPWIIGGLILLGALFFLLRGCDRKDVTPVGNTIENTTIVDDTVVENTTAPVEAAAVTGTGLEEYLKGQDPVGRSYAFDRVTFASGSAALNADATAQVNEVAAVLKRYPNARVSLIGFADPEGDATANKKLSAERATAVRKALVKGGSADGQVASAEAAGETGSTATRGNRRVEIRVDGR